MQEENQNIIWLASYPKSGNTWLRILISNLMSGSSQPVNINELLETPISSSRIVIDDYSGVHSSELTPEEIDTCWDNSRAASERGYETFMFRGIGYKANW